MDHIPIELLHEAFIKLDLKDKLECMLVCRFWYNTLDRRSLLDTLSVRSRVFLKLKKMIEHHPYRAKQVEILKLSADFDKRILCNMFPNLWQAIMPPYSGIERTNHLDSPFQFTHATSKLEKIVESGECELTRQLAMSNMCSNLKSLELLVVNQPGLLGSNMLSQLKNMPVLETLRLREFQLKLMDLETMHRNIPSIKHLRLDSLKILSGEIPHDVIPAELITKLYINLFRAKNLSTHIELYKYLAKKYPSVTKPTFVDGVILNQNRDYNRDAYNKGMIPCLQNIGSKIDTFSFGSYCDGLDAFRKFDDSGIKLKELSMQHRFDSRFLLFGELAQSQQSKSIQKLILSHIALEPFEMMINMKVLTYLEIDFGDFALDDGAKETINFSDLVEACPATLTHVKIKRVTLTFNESASNVTSIQSLKLSDVDTKPGAANIGANFPKLSILRVYAFTEGNFTISLPSNHLKEADIHTNCPQNKGYSLSINIMYEGRPQRTVIWPIPDIGSKGEMYCSDKSESELKNDWVVDFTCASVEKLAYSIIKNEDEHDNDDDEYLY